MIDDGNFADICRRLESDDAGMVAAGIWLAASCFHRYSHEERERVLYCLRQIEQRWQNDPDVGPWLVHFVEHANPYLDVAGRDIGIGILRQALVTPDLGLNAKSLECIARSNRLLTDEQLLVLCGDILRYSAAPPDQRFSEGTLFCACALIDYVGQPMRSALAEMIGRLQEEVGSRWYYTPEPILDTAQSTDVVFLIPEFLSGKSFLQPPLGALIGATVMRAAGVPAAILDNRVHHLSPRSIEARLSQVGARCIIVVSTPYDQVSIYYCDYRWHIILDTVKHLKRAGFRVVLCGSHGTLKPGHTMLATGCDAIVRGEWDLTPTEMVRALRHNAWNWGCLAEVPNLAYRNGDKVVLTEVNEALWHPQVAELPMPDYDLVVPGAYYGDEYVENQPRATFNWGSILAQRGCPHGCAFCYNFFGHQVRRRSPEQVAEEMKVLETRYGISHLFFIDYTFTEDRNWVVKLCAQIKARNLRVRWNCETRPDRLDDDLLRTMRDANCYRIWLGAESFSDGLLDEVNKGTRESQILEAIRRVRTAGIAPSCFLMLGLPGETPETLEYTLRRVRDTGVEYTKSIITVVPRFGTKLFERARGHLRSDAFEEMNSLRGLVDNQITAQELTSAITLMARRDSGSWTFDDETA